MTGLHRPRLVSIACLLLTCLLCAGPGALAATPRPIVLLVSLDGFRADYLSARRTPRLAALAAAGVHAPAMHPSYPVLTFPNHYTLVTGQRPDHHGVVGNQMHDRQLGDFWSGNGSAADGRWFDDAEPIWVTARRAGLRVATLFWPGSEAEIHGLRPNAWFHYDGDVPAARRVEQVLDWLRLPDDQRPQFITLYFEQIDHAGHLFGPDSRQMRRALADTDRAIGLLLDGLHALRLDDAVDLIVVSDHGMAEQRGLLRLDRLVDPKAVEIWSIGEVTLLEPRPGFEAALAALPGRHGHVECFRRGQVPARWQFGTHRRVPAFVCQCDEGYKLFDPSVPEEHRTRRKAGGHGYDPALPSMQALFLASGPSFRQHTEIPAFDNVELYPLLARLLGVAPQPNDAQGVLPDQVLRP